MSPKTGRPKAENPKDVRFTIRLDAETDKRLCEYCDQNGITRAEAIRTAINRLLSKKK